jgi:hypothetical protein
VKNGVANSDILRSYLGQLVQGKSDFDAVENFRGDAFFKQALDIRLLPLSPTLRQRMDARAVELFDFLPLLIETLLGSARSSSRVVEARELQRQLLQRRGRHAQAVPVPVPARLRTLS